MKRVQRNANRLWPAMICLVEECWTYVNAVINKRSVSIDGSKFLDEMRKY